MKATKKVLSVLLSVLLMATACVPALASSTYDRAMVAQSDADYISSLTAEETAGIILDWLDRKVASVTADFNNFEIEVLGNTVEIPLDIDSVEDILQYADYVTQLGGDFAKLDVTALKGLSRANGDIAFINGIVDFASANAATLSKLAQWEEGKTFDLGKVGEYIDSLEDGNEIKNFVNSYIKGGDLDITININNVVAEIADGLKENGLLSEEGAALVKESINLEEFDAYSAVKELVRLVQADNEAALKTAYTYYLDNLVRPMLKYALGFTRSYGAEASADVPYTDLAELKKLAGDNEILAKVGDKYYAFTLDAANAVTGMKEVLWTQAISLEPVTAEISSGTGVINTYKPMSADIAPRIYTTYADKLADTDMAAYITGTTVPEEYAALMVDENKAPEMKDFFAVKASQGENVLFDLKVEFTDIERYAEEQASVLALAEIKKAFDAAGVVYGDDLSVSVDITMNYDGFATDDEFIVNVSADAVPSMSGIITYNVPIFGETTVDINMAISILKNLGIDVDKMIQDEIAKVLTNPVATVVVDNLSGDGSELGAVLELANMIDTDFDIDYSIIDFYGNYDAHNGVIGEVNDILCGIVEMFTSDEGYASLGLTKGLNDNLTANMQKICKKGGETMALAKKYLDKNGFEELVKSFDVDSFFASSHGFNAGMIFDLDFSSVENLYVCGIRVLLDLVAKDEEGTLLYDIHMAVEDLDTLEKMASAVYDVVFERINKALTDKLGAKGYAYTFAKTDANAVTEANAKDVIMTKVADFALYAATFVFEDYVPGLVNGFIHDFNTEVGTDIPDASFTFGVEKGATYTETLTATVDRIYEILDGICIPTTGFTGTLADKINNLFCSVLPMGAILSNCKSDGYCCDIAVIEDAIFNKALDGDFDTLLRFFETAEKTEDIAADVPASLAVIKAFEHGADAFLPDTINSELYDGTSLATFFCGDNVRLMTENGIKSFAAHKEALVPALLKLVGEIGLLPYFCRCEDGAHIFVDVAEIPATCTKEGRTASKVCSVCGKTEGGEVIAKDPSNHVNVVDVPALDARCTVSGVSAGTKCADCGAVISGCEEIRPTGHFEEAVPGKAPTCTETGLSDGIVCSVCGETLKAQTEIPAKGHSFGEDGICTECGAKKPEESKNFFQKIADFFKKIINWFKNLFK